MARIRGTIGVLLVIVASAAAPVGGQTGLDITSPVAPATGVQTPSASAGGSMPSVGELVTVFEKATAPSPNGSEASEPAAGDWATPVKLVVIFAGLAILPSLLVMMTSFTRIVIVLSFVRRALSTQSIPPTVAVIGLALFLTMYTMAPTYARMNAEAIQPYLTDKASLGVAATKAGECMKDFMLRQSRKGDVALFVEMAKAPMPTVPTDIPLHIVVPAFIISEFRTAFEIGCLLFIPFLLIDMVIASVLLSAGMMMLPPVMISLPFKLILFILVDGWGLLAKSLSLGFR
ncbi:MAG TPA: flagellar type III secretion system pore protein FliP [Sedimentisphaerales bacterium]|jgi:flagellar biosynthetic protein FliP|nr:flagellar type III secretion system pore protein FliP [Sedimentisphaerales bacterium]HNU27738.1 flagellar type III secretion system pore protein FliP [Sedimentisphaerales bacterium]